MSDKVWASEEKFQATFNQAAVGLAHVATNGSWVIVNDKLCQILGYTREELMRITFQDITHPEDLKSDLNLVALTLSGKIPNYSIEKRYIRKDKEAVWANLTVSLVRTSTGEPDYFISVVEDISLRKKVEKEMEDIQVKLEQLVEERTMEKIKVQQELSSFFTISNDLMAVFGNDGYVRRVNRAFTDMLGYSEEEIMSTPLPHFLHPEDQREQKTLVHKLAQTEGQFKGFENRYIAKDGSIKHVSWSAAKMPETSYSLIIGRDVTEQRKQEKIIAEEKVKLAAASRINALGRMAANIAHEINNPLTVIYGQSCQMSEMFATESFDKEKLRKISTDIGEMASRISTIIRGLRLFAREGSQDKTSLKNVYDLITETLPFCNSQLRSAEVSFDMHEVDRNLEIPCRAVQISQVILNLINNALDALQDRDKKEISIKTEKIKDKARILVIDNGSGVDALTEANLFESFFTTKPIGKGTGLGLNISRQIIESHKGRIFFQPYEGRTCFVIELPL